MRASNVTLRELIAAAREVEVTLDAVPHGRQFQVKLLPLVSAKCYTAKGRRHKGERGNAKYQRESASMFSGGRRVNAVCWHGFRDFFRAVYRQAPNAVFKTSLDTWKGSEDFEARYKESGHKNIGAPIAPVPISNACRCPESGYAS